MAVGTRPLTALLTATAIFFIKKPSDYLVIRIIINIFATWKY